MRLTRTGFALGVYGFSTMAGQILIMRQLITVLYGNELSIGLFLGVWLLLTAFGSAILGPVIARILRPATLFAVLQVLFGLALVGELYVVRLARPLFYPEVLVGELVRVNEILLVPPVVLAPVCVLSGIQFAVGSRMHEDPGRTYAAVAAGDLIAGLLVSSALVLWLGPFALAGAVLVLSATVPAVLAQGRLRIGLAGLAAILAAGLVIARAPGALEQTTLTRQWAPLQVDGEFNSVHGEIVVTANEGLYTFFQGGIVFHIPDRYTAEDLIHFPLLAHPNPKSVLLIGLGVAGGVAEALKHDPELVHYAELDPALYRVGRSYAERADPDAAAALDDPRVRVFLEDGRLYVRRTVQRYDVILVNVPDPSTIQLNRFYTQEFFEEARRLLKPEGLLSVTISSNPVFLGDAQARLNACLVRTMQRVFPHVEVLPGETMIVLGSVGDSPSATDAETLARRLNERGIANQFVNDSYIRFGCDRTEPFTRRQVEEALANVPPLEVNRDFSPVCNYYQTSFWSALVSGPGERTWFERAMLGLASLRVWPMVAGLGCLGVVVAFLGVAWGPARRLALLGNVAAVAFVGLTVEVAILFAFQAIYGYVYYKVGILVAAFMVGSVIGSRWGGRLSMAGPSDVRRIAIVLSVVGSVYALLTPLIILLLASFRHASGTFVAMQILFPVLAGLGGLVVGIMFPAACRLLVGDGGSDRQQQGAGVVYAADLVGAALGSFLAGAVLLPATGLWGTCDVAAAALAAAGGAWGWVSRPKVV